MVDQVVVTAPDQLAVVQTRQEVPVVAVQREVQVVSAGSQGPAGPPGPSGSAAIAAVAGAAIGGHRVVLYDAAGEVVYASNDSLAHAGFVLGMTLTAAAAGDAVNVQRYGEVEEVSWNWTLGQPIYLGTNGLLTQTAPVGPAAKFVQVVAFPVTATKAFVNIREPILIA